MKKRFCQVNTPGALGDVSTKKLILLSSEEGFAGLISGSSGMCV